MDAVFYQQELEYLRDMAQEFARTYPGVNTSALLAPQADPDVERLLQGFAFLAARVRERIEDDLPELSHTLMGLLWPEMLRPTPSLCVVGFSSGEAAFRDRKRIAAGAEVRSAGAGVACRFRTCWDLDLLPVALTDVRLDRAADGTRTVVLSCEMLAGVAFDSIFVPRPSGRGARHTTAPPLNGLRLFVHEHEAATAIAQALTRNVERIEMHSPELARQGAGKVVLPAACSTPAALSPAFDVLADPPRRIEDDEQPDSLATRTEGGAFATLAVLRDYFVFPERYRFIDVTGLDRAVGLGVGRTFDLVFRLSAWPDAVTRLTPNNIRLGCVPVANLFEHDARPFGAARDRAEYPVVPFGDGDHQMETVEVRGVIGRAKGTGREREFAPLYSLVHQPQRGGESRVYYTTRVRPSIDGRSTETWLRLVDVGEATAFVQDETVIARLLCTDGRHPVDLAPGDLCEPGTDVPAGVTFRDITRFTPPLQPSLGGEASWRLISLIAASYLTLADRETLRRLLKLMDFRSVHDRAAERRLTQRLQAIEEVRTSPDDCLVAGRVVRGRAVEVRLRDRDFGGLAEVQLFGSVLDVVFAMFSSINSHVRLTIHALDSRDLLAWPPRHGTQILH